MPKKVSIEDYSKPIKYTLDANHNPSIWTKEDLNDFNKKFIDKNKYTTIGGDSKEESWDPSLIIFGSVNNKTLETPQSQATTIKSLKKSSNFKFGVQNISNKMKQSESLMSIKENFENSIFEKAKLLQRKKKNRSKSKIGTKRKSTSISMVPTSDKHSDISHKRSDKFLIGNSQSEIFDIGKDPLKSSKAGFKMNLESISDPNKRFINNSSKLSNQAPTFAADGFKASKMSSNYQRFMN